MWLMCAAAEPGLAGPQRRGRPRPAQSANRHIRTLDTASLALLMAVVVAFLDRPALTRWTPAVVAVGVATLIFAGGLTSGGSFNPARQLGPLLFAGQFSYLGAYLLGPVVGALILVALVRAMGLPRPLTCDLCGHGSGTTRPSLAPRIAPRASRRTSR